MPAALRRRLEHINPDLAPPIPEAAPDNSQFQRAFFENAADGPPCTCRAMDGHGSNPLCVAHPWWRHDDAALHLADHMAAGDTAWEAAAKVYGGAHV